MPEEGASEGLFFNSRAILLPGHSSGFFRDLLRAIPFPIKDRSRE